MKQQNLKQKKDIAAKSKQFRSWILSKVIDKDKNNCLYAYCLYMNTWWPQNLGYTIKNRDANLWRPKIGRLSFFHYPHPEKLTQPPMGMT